VPLDVIRAKKEIRELNQEEHMGKLNPFREEAVFDLGGEQKIEPSDQHWKARIEQLMGKFGPATAHFLSVRHLALEKPPEKMAQVHPQEFQAWMLLYQLAANDASYWSAAGKIEQGDLESAVTALQDYLKRYSRTDWASPARSLQVLTLARLNKLDEAR